MAYVEWHQEIRNHWKTDDLMRRLGIQRYEALGILGAITSWAIGHRPGGIIERKLIQVAVEWKKEPEPLVQALLDAGWLDVFDDDRVEVHDWEDITQGYRKARKDATRKKRERAERARAKEKDFKDKPKNGRGTSKERPRTASKKTRPKSVHGRSTERRSEQNEQNEQNERTRAGQPPQKSYNNHNHPPSSGSSRGTRGDEQGVVVAVSDRKEGEHPHSPPPAHAEAPKERLQKQASIRLSTPILEAIGVDGGVAEQLARAYPAVRILHVAEHAKKQENPGGFARKALELGWTVPDSNGTGLANLLAALEEEVTANERAWDRMGRSPSGREAPDYPQRREGEDERAYTTRVNDWLKSKKTGGQQ